MAAKLVSLSLISLFLISAVLTSFSVQLVYAYSNTAYGFSMTPPSGWTVNEGVSGTVVMFVGPVIPETGGNININVVAGNTNETLSEAISSIKASYPTDFTNFSEVSESSRTIGGMNAYEIVYTWSQGGNDFEDKQVFFVQSGQDFIITCTALPTNYATYSSTFEQSIQTFQLSPAGIPLTTILVVIAIIIVVIVVIVAVARSRKNPKSEPMQPPPPPPPSP
jgi:hypothetical protein